MNIESIRMEMDIAGCVQFFHPALQHDYYIIEQKLDKDHNFIPIEDGVYVFHVMKGHDNAIQTELTDITHLYEFIKQLYEEDYNILPDHMEIPKKNFVKWQFDRKLK